MIVSLNGKVTGKGKVARSMQKKTYRGCRNIAPPILNLSTTCRSVFSFIPQPLYPREVWWTPELIWTLWRRGKCVAHAGNQTPD
jgi:hypothetical protein